jgi:hypothetical protein
MLLFRFKTYLPKTHFVGQDAIFTLAPQVCQPVQSSELEILQFATSFGDIFRIFSNLLKGRALGSRVSHTFVRKLGLCFPLTIRFKLLPRNRTDLFQRFPCAVFIIEAIPLAEVFDFTLDAVAVRNDTFNRLVKFEVLLLTFLVQEECFALL